MKPKIVLSGGGTAGHVTPNIALIEALHAEGWHVDYIGMADSVEQRMMIALHVPFHVIQAGKLRRYFSWKTLLSPFQVLWGIRQSYRLLGQLRPDIVFSKGGFVSFPVVVGAWLCKIPVIAHESDRSPGLANRLSYPFVNKICLTFEPARLTNKSVMTGTPLRSVLLQGSAERARQLTGFKADKPCVLIMGGSQGATPINGCVRQGIEQLTQHFQVIHLCGTGKQDDSLLKQPHYFQMEYADKELPDLLAMSDVVVSRAGANTLYELLVLNKPHILIPLPLQASRGDQIHNAHYFQAKGVSAVIEQAVLTPETLLETLQGMMLRKEDIKHKMQQLNITSGTEKVMTLFRESIRPRL